MNCPQCGYDSQPGFAFCPKCGTALQQICARCGFQAPVDFAFCPQCGNPHAAPREEPARLPEAGPMVARLQRLVPKEYAQRLLASRGQVSPERRTVTILFSDVAGSTTMAGDLDPEEVMEVMGGAFDVLIEPVYRHEGTLARLMGDAVLAFFGAPIAHEDDPERACRAALEILAGAGEYAARLEGERGIRGFSVRVGIHTGLVVVGEVGSDLRVEYTAMGDAINLASRMEQHAPPGGILITHDTYRHVRGVFDVLAQEPLVVKGRDERVQTYLVQQAKPRAFRLPSRGVEGIDTPMVGREAELKRLQEALYAALEDGELQMVTVVGEAGVGKSRLLHEFDAWAELLPQQVYYFKGRPFPGMQSMPYGVIRDLIAFRFQIQDSDAATVVREKLEAGVARALGAGERSRQAAHRVGHLVGFEFGASPELAGMQDDPQGTRDQAVAFVEEYLRGMAAQSPVLILLEDLQWADDSSLDLLNHLGQGLRDQSVLVVGAARPELFERRPHWGEGQSWHRRLPLEPLSKWDSRRLVAEILQKAPDVPDALRDLIVAGAEGNPFFIEELVKMLVEDGVIVKGEEQWRVVPSRLVDLRVPPTLTGVLQARLDRLPLEERTVLQQASVVGRLFWDRAVARINASEAEGVDETEITDRLSALRSREMVFQRETSAFADAREYIFKHNMLREITYEGVLKRLRRVYHGLVADWLIEQGGERAEEYTGLIADHLELAGRMEEALEYLLRAGDRARTLYAHQEAVGAYERALALLKQQAAQVEAPERLEEQAARTLMKLGLTHEAAFDCRRAREAYEEGFTLWQRAALAGAHGQAGTPPAPLHRPAPHALRLRWLNPMTLDPSLAADLNSWTVVSHLFCGLVELTADMAIVPAVAESCRISPDGCRYTFHLRDGVVWSDGAPVTAHDFAYAWERVLDPVLASPNASLLYDVVGARAYHQGVASWSDVGVQAVDDRTLAVELEGPTGYFLPLMAYTGACPVPRHVVEAHGEAWTQPGTIVTNGPFLLESWVRGEFMALTRLPKYHGRVQGNVDRVELALVASLAWSGGLELYERDELDLLHLVQLGQGDPEIARQRHPGEYVTAPILDTFYLGFHPGLPPLDDRRVRRALVLATDREGLANVVFKGNYFPATGGLVPPGMPGHSPGIALPYDPEGARGLLAEAGYTAGRGFPRVEGLAFHGCEAATEAMTGQWRENLGIEVGWELTDWATHVDRVSRELPPLHILGWQPDYLDPDNYLRVDMQRFTTPWGNEAYDRLVERARRLTDQEERMRLYRQADRMLMEAAIVMPWGYGRQHLLVKPWVRGFPISAMGDFSWKDLVLEPH